jgi:membrane protein
MSGTKEDDGITRLRRLAERVVERVGGLSAVRTLLATLDVYDVAGGGLVAGGLAYTSLLALLPGLLLALSIAGLLLGDPAAREQVVSVIATAFPPLEDLARAALSQVAAGAVPSGILAVVGLLWGSSRFYAALDNAFSRVFHNAPRRNEVVRTIRGLVVTGLFVALPIMALVAGSLATWLLDMVPGAVEADGVRRGLWQLATPLLSFALFFAGTVAVYRWVPAVRVPVRALLPPAVLAAIVLSVFTQVFTFIAPRLAGIAALYGAFVAVFALLAWLSIGFNVLLLGASWTRVRVLTRGEPAAAQPDPGRSNGSDEAAGD